MIKKEVVNSQVKVEVQLLSPAELNTNNILKDSIEHLSNTITDPSVGFRTSIVKHKKAILKQ